MPELAILHAYPLALAQYREHFETAGDTTALPRELIEGVCWRESRAGLVLTPPGPEGTGDNGHGHGLMQIDRGDGDEHVPFLNAVDEAGVPLWKKPKTNILYGAQVLRSAIDTFPGDLDAGVARYNASLARIRRFVAAGKTANDATTGGNYVVEVLGHAKLWHLARVAKPEACGCLLCCYLILKETRS